MSSIRAASLVCREFCWFWHKCPLWWRNIQLEDTTQLPALWLNTDTVSDTSVQYGHG